MLGLIVALVAVFEKVAHDVNEATFVAVGLVRGAFHEQTPVRVALGCVRRVSVFDLSKIVQKSGKLCRKQFGEKSELSQQRQQ